jgi:cyclohexa-1,5-dienecarbonyl-CoA hydratase
MDKRVNGSEKMKARLIWNHDGKVARIVMAAPKANILDRGMISDLSAAFDLCQAHELNAIILTADGPSFSYGASVEEHLPEQIERTLSHLHSLLRQVANATAPVICAVRGQCLGGGFELALACDMIFASSTAQFGCPEIKLGVFAPAASALLPHRIGVSRSTQMLLTGNSISAEEARSIGLVALVVPDDKFEEQLEDWIVKDFLPRSPAALRFASAAARANIRAALHQELSHLEELYLRGLMSHPDAEEGIRSFIEKRQPRWNTAATHKMQV